MAAPVGHCRAESKGSSSGYTGTSWCGLRYSQNPNISVRWFGEQFALLLLKEVLKELPNFLLQKLKCDG